MKPYLSSLIITILLLVSGCDSPPPEPKNEYEKAVYHSNRPDSDIKQDKRRKPAAIIEFSGVKAGMFVADLQAGSGYYTELYSYFVGDQGQVYLHNLPNKADREDIRAKIDKRLENNRLTNVTEIKSEITNLSFPQPVDLIIMSKIYHDFYVPEKNSARDEKISAIFEQLKLNLKPNGKVLVIDHAAEKGTGESFTSKTHRIEDSFAISEFEKNGFSLKNRTDALVVESDDKSLNIWESKVINKTSRFVLLFELKNQ